MADPKAAAERFGLQLHHEARELMGYELAIGKDGHKLQPPLGTATETDATHVTMHLQAGNDRMPPRSLEGAMIYWNRSLGIGILKLSNGLFRAVGISQTIAELIASARARPVYPSSTRPG
jgi:uncharacterized protein (TIGR03435 family)